MAKEDKQTLEDMLQSLDECVKKLESADISLEDSFHEYEKGMKLVRACNDTIDKVEKDVLKLEDNGETTVFDSVE